jgi:hypothetical protein
MFDLKEKVNFQLRIFLFFLQKNKDGKNSFITNNIQTKNTFQSQTNNVYLIDGG